MIDVKHSEIRLAALSTFTAEALDKREFPVPYPMLLMDEVTVSIPVIPLASRRAVSGDGRLPALSACTRMLPSVRPVARPRAKATGTVREGLELLAAVVAWLHGVSRFTHKTILAIHGQKSSATYSQLDPGYCAIARKRIDAATRQSRLFP